MPKTTRLDMAKADTRNAAVKALRLRGSATNEKSVKSLSERLALIEEILGVRSQE